MTRFTSERRICESLRPCYLFCTGREGPCYLCALPEKDHIIFVHCQRRTLLSLYTASEGPYYLCALPKKDLVIFVHCQRMTLLSLCTARKGPCYLYALPEKDLAIFVHRQRIWRRFIHDFGTNSSFFLIPSLD